jgi:hypothetical protein
LSQSDDEIYNPLILECSDLFKKWVVSEYVKVDLPDYLYSNDNFIETDPFYKLFYDAFSMIKFESQLELPSDIVDICQSVLKSIYDNEAKDSLYLKLNSFKLDVLPALNLTSSTKLTFLGSNSSIRVFDYEDSDTESVDTVIVDESGYPTTY